MNKKVEGKGRKLVTDDYVEINIAIKKPDNYSVFISHAVEDVELATQLQSLLKDLNISSFVAHKDITKGHNWQNIILENLKKSCLLVILGTKKVEKSPWVNFEVGYGYEKMIPIIFEELSDKVSYIKSQQGIKMKYDNTDKSVMEIVDIIISKLGLIKHKKHSEIEHLGSYRKLTSYINKNFRGSE